MTIMLKGCAKCHGDLHLDRDVYGERLVCWQCGQDYDVPSGRYEPYAPIREPPITDPALQHG